MIIETVYVQLTNGRQVELEGVKSWDTEEGVLVFVQENAVQIFPIDKVIRVGIYGAGEGADHVDKT